MTATTTTPTSTSRNLEEVHNHIATLVFHHLKEGKASVAEAVLALEMIRADLVAQVSSRAYKGQ